jgi:hypothetical protein
MPAITSVPHRGAGDGARHSAAFDILFRRLVRHVHGLGPRAVGEALLELAPNRGAVVAVLERYERFTPAFVRSAGGDDWLEPRRLLREIRR